jgi:hypothetical protein
MKPAKAKRKFLKRLYCIVKREIDRLDVLQIFEFGAPPDEYDLEIRDICQRITLQCPRRTNKSCIRKHWAVDPK